MPRPLLIAALLCCWVLPATAAIYRWVDERGTVNFSTDAPPAGVQASVVTLPPDTAGLSAPNPSAQSASAASTPAAAPAKRAHRVELFVTSWCPWCKKAEAFFRARGIAVTVYDIERDTRAAQRKVQLDPQRGVPFALVDGTPVHGYSESRYKAALGEEE